MFVHMFLQMLPYFSSFHLCMLYIFFFMYVFLSAINEFPEDIFTNKERQQGGILLHIIAVSFSLLCFIFVFLLCYLFYFYFIIRH